MVIKRTGMIRGSRMEPEASALRRTAPVRGLLLILDRMI